MFSLSSNSKKDIVVFSDFKKNSESFDFYEAVIKIDYENFMYCGLIEIEKSDLTELVFNLNSIWNRRIQSFIFQPINDRLKINFEVNDIGHIKVNLFITNLTFNSNLNIAFVVDQSYIQQIIDDINNLEL